MSQTRHSSAMARGGLVLAGAFAALASGPPASAGQEEQRWLVFSGASVADDSYYFYSGVRAALSGDITKSGLIAGVTSGSGLYRYASGVTPGGTIAGRFVLVEATGGYQWSAPQFGFAVMAGARYEDHRLSAPDPGNRVQGDEAGLAGLAELWARPVPGWMVTAGASATSVFGGYHVRASLARKLPFGTDLYAGIEAALMGNDEYRQTRAGVMVSGVDIGIATLSASAGLVDDSETGDGVYGTLGAWGMF